MPRLSTWFIRSALSHLVLGFTFGGLLLFHKGCPSTLLCGDCCRLTLNFSFLAGRYSSSWELGFGYFLAFYAPGATLDRPGWPLLCSTWGCGWLASHPCWTDLSLFPF